MFCALEPGDQAVLSNKGKYSLHALYEMDGKLYAQMGSAFVGFNKNGSTTNNMKIEKLVTDRPLWADQFGRLLTDPKAATKAKPLTVADTGVLQITKEEV